MSSSSPDIKEHVRQFAQAVSGVNRLIQPGTAITKDLVQESKSMLGDLQRHIDAISSSVASASEITSAHQQLQSHVVTVMQRIRASTPQFVSEEEVSHLRLVIVTLSGAVKACCVTGLNDGQRASILRRLSTSILSSQAKSTSPTSTLAPAPLTVLEEEGDDEYTLKLKRTGFEHRSANGSIVHLTAEALPPSLDLSNLAEIFQRFEMGNQSGGAASNLHRSAPSLNDPSAAALAPEPTPTTTRRASYSAAQGAPAAPIKKRISSSNLAYGPPSIKRDVPHVSYNHATVTTEKMQQDFKSYLPAFAQASSSLTIWFSRLAAKPETLATVLPVGRNTVQELVAQVSALCALSQSSTFSLDELCASLIEEFEALERNAETADAAVVADAVARIQKITFLLAGGIKMMITLNVLLKRQSIFQGWKKERARLPSMPDQSVKKVIRLMLVGNQSAGKTSLIRAFCKAPFEPEGAPTHGVELRVYKAMIGDELMELQILDATGNPLLRGSYDPFYSVVEGVFIVYDASDASAPAEEALDSWMAEVAPYSFLQPLIVGNKADTAEQVAAADERGKAIMERYGVPHIAVSCKENINIDEAFLILLHNVNDSGIMDEHKERAARAADETTQVDKYTFVTRS